MTMRPEIEPYTSKARDRAAHDHGARDRAIASKTEAVARQQRPEIEPA